MADFRTVQTRMWREDEWFQNLKTDARLLWMYLFTNPSANAAGLYRLPIRTIAFESGLDLEQVERLLDEFAYANKAHYENGIVYVVKMQALQHGDISWQIATRIAADVDTVPDGRLKQMYLARYGYPIVNEKVDERGKTTRSIEYQYPIDGQSIPHRSTDTYTHTDTPTDTPTDTDTQKPSLSPAWEAFIKARGVNVNPNDPQYIGELEALYGSDAVAQAIYYCDTHKKNNYLAVSYISKMLSVWQGEGSLGLHPPGTNGNGNGKSEPPKKRKQRVYDAEGNLIEVEVDA